MSATRGVVRKKGKKNRKHKRNLKGPAHMRYTNEKRWIKNKAKKIRKFMKSHPKWRANNISDDVAKVLKK